MREFTGRVECRTSLEQAARIAGLAGELGITESEVVRLLLERGLRGKPYEMLHRQVRAQRIEKARSRGIPEEIIRERIGT
jgi:hypothetical protein